MPKILTIFSVVVILLLPQQTHAWGFWAHQRINRLAVFTLPPELLAFYKAHITYITEHAVDPDKRRYAVHGEAARHYIDIDHYGKYPFEDLPRNWNDAVEKLTKDTLESYGILPYQLPRRIQELEEAFRKKDLVRILKLSADIGHYIGDSHVPLHTTKNYNGQLTGQKGIHGFWESRLPELYGENWDFFVGKCYYINDVYKEGWDAVLESHVAVDSVLSFEKQLSQQFPSDQKYSFESRNNLVVRTYSREYSAAYLRMMNGMVERRMRKSIKRIGSYWYTAWKRAGSPDLSELVDQKIKYNPKNYKKIINIIDREGNGSLGFLRKSELYNDVCCRWKPLMHTVSCVKEDPHHEKVVAMIRERRAAQIAALEQRSLLEKVIDWIDYWV